MKNIYDMYDFFELLTDIEIQGNLRRLNIQ